MKHISQGHISSTSKDKNKRKRSSSISDNNDDGEKKRHKKHKKKHKKKHRKEKKRSKEKVEEKNSCEESADVPLELIDSSDSSRNLAPMTKEQWEKQQSVVRRVYDESSGRSRLIKGDGEVIEEIVSKDRHKAINKQATQGDGSYFQTQLSATMKK